MPRWWRHTAVGAVVGCLLLASVPMVRWLDTRWQHHPPITNSSYSASAEAEFRAGDGFGHRAPNPRADPPAAGHAGGRGSASGGGQRNRPRSDRILVGANVQANSDETWQDALARVESSYGPLRMHRVFYPQLPPPWPGSRAAGGGVTVVVSFKAAPRDIISGAHDAELANWFATAPRDRDVYWVYYHEPEDNIEDNEFTANDYRKAWRKLAELADLADHPRLYSTLVLMCWTLESSSGRNWRDYYPGSDVIAVLGWDCYNSGGDQAQVYLDPAQRFQAAIEVSRAEGKPWGIAETGSVLVPGDESGEQRAAWLRDVGDYLTNHNYPPLWVAYFDSTVGGDFRLRDRPSQRAWREFIRAQD